MNNNEWHEIKKFHQLRAYVGKMIEYQFSNSEGTRGKAGIGFMSHKEPQQTQQSFLNGLGWFLENQVSGRGVHSNSAIEESDFKCPIKKIRVLTDEEAAKIELSYSYPNPYKEKCRQ